MSGGQNTSASMWIMKEEEKVDENKMQINNNFLPKVHARNYTIGFPEILNPIKLVISDSKFHRGFICDVFLLKNKKECEIMVK